jgi:alpha-tubulin suppressor-like RCC1 family protein
VRPAGYCLGVELTDSRILRGGASLVALCLACLGLCGSVQAAGATAVAWGDNNSGELGTTPPAEICTPFHCMKSPSPVSGLSGVTQIATSETHTLALLSNGTVLAWGYNGYGQLGDGSIEESSTPVTVSGIANAIQVAASTEHSLALLAVGRVMAWGENGYGDLGTGSNEGPEECPFSCSKVPRPVPGLSEVVAIAAGDQYSLALLADGTVVAWGYDEYGTIGDGGVAAKARLCRCVPSPTPVPGVSGAMAISASSKLGMALLGDGRVMDWGENYDGELGNGTDNTAAGEAPCYCVGPVEVSGLTGAKAVAAGAYHGLALRPDGTLVGWGYNGDGELGIGSFAGPENCGGDPCSRVPVTVSGLSGVTAISAGYYHTLALLSNGTVDAWGFNFSGQLGNGTTSSADLPTAVSGVSGASGVAAHDSASFALLGPTQTLNVAFAGAGTGTVGGAAGLLCPPACSSGFPQGAVETLRAAPSAPSAFAGFSGACTGNGLCRATMGQDQQVTATFGPPKGTMITKSKTSSRKKSALFRFSAPGAITGFECELVRPRPHRHHRKHKSNRGLERARPRFAACGPASKTYKHLRLGRYTFKVRALDILGADAVPAVKRFQIKLVKHKKHRSQH